MKFIQAFQRLILCVKALFFASISFSHEAFFITNIETFSTLTLLGDNTRGIVLPLRVVHRRRGVVRGDIRARDEGKDSG